MMEALLAAQTLGTLGFVLAFAYAARRATEKYRRSNPPKSALARDNAYMRITGTYGR